MGLKQKLSLAPIHNTSHPKFVLPCVTSCTVSEVDMEKEGSGDRAYPFKAESSFVLQIELSNRSVGMKMHHNSMCFVG